MKVFRDLSKKIQNCINDFVNDPEPFLIRWDKEIVDVREIACKLNVLPILSDWGHQWGLNLKSEVICFPVDDPEEIEIIDIQQKQFLSMRRRVYLLASQKYPELKELMPQRPETALTCTTCQGTGRNPINDILNFTEEAIGCICGGLGWLPKDEDYSITITNMDEYM